MRQFLMKYGTPLTAGLFLVSTVSGVALFFGWQQSIFHEMHEILSMVLIVPFVVHVWRNWRAFVNYFSKAAMPISLALSLAAAGVFVASSLNAPSGGNPAFALVRAAQSAPISSLAPVLKIDEATAVERLSAAGFTDVAPTDTITDIASRSGRDTFEVIAGLTQPAS